MLAAARVCVEYFYISILSNLFILPIKVFSIFRLLNIIFSVSMSDKDLFTPLSEDSIKSLLTQLELHLPNSIHALCFLRTILRWRSVIPAFNHGIFAPRGNYSDCTFFLYFCKNDELHCTCYSLTEEGTLNLRDALMSSDKVPWKNEFSFTCIPEMLSVLLDPLWTYKKVTVDHYPGITYCLRKERAECLNISCPSDIYIKNLTPSEAGTIDAAWPYKNSKSVFMIEEIIKVNFGIGAFLRETNELVSWGVHWYYGGIGAIQTAESHKGKGYATAVTVSIIKRLLKEDWPIHLSVVEENVGGQALFGKLGFESVFQNQWICSALSN